MTLPVSGTISMSQVSVELSRASTYATSLGETAVRNLAGVASGAISFANLHGKSSIYVPWTGTVTVGLMSGQLYGVYRSSGGTLFAGNSTNSGGTGPNLKSFYYDITGGNQSWLVFYSTPTGDPSQLTMTFNGSTTQMMRYAAGTYWCTGDFWGLSSKNGNTYNASMTIP